MASNAVTIGNTAPTVASAKLTPDPAFETSTLTFAAGTTSDVDGDKVSVRYGWTVNGSTIKATGSTLTGTYFNKKDVVVVLSLRTMAP